MRTRPPVSTVLLRTMHWAEQAIVFLVGVLLFAAAAALLYRSALQLPTLFGSEPGLIEFGTAFLNLILLVLMLVELARTVMLSLRGIVLTAEPFLVVGLIAVIRRTLVITIGEGPANAGKLAANATSHGQELLVLGALMAIFVVSIFLLRLRPHVAEEGEAL